MNITIQMIKEDLTSLKKTLNKIPTKKEYERYGKYSSRTIRARFGSWNKCLLSIFSQNHRLIIGKTKKHCKNCNKEVERMNSYFGDNTFCSKSCATSFNNTLRRKSRRSKIEIKLFEQLEKRFPTIKFIPNDKEMLNGLEVDIAAPSLKLAIEWNGIVHFKPIYGQKKLDRIKFIDQQKLLIAQQKDINLIVIPDLVSNKTVLDKAFKQICLIINNLNTKCPLSDSN